MSLAFERLLTRRDDRSKPRPAEQIRVAASTFGGLHFRGVDTGSLKEAGDSRAAWRANHLVVPQVVPYPLPLTSPPVLMDWNESRFRVIASESPVETKVALYLCRDRVETLTAVLNPHSWS